MINRRFHTGVLFLGIVPIVPGILRSHQKDLELELFFANLFRPHLHGNVCVYAPYALSKNYSVHTH